ncbi:D-lyxose/D-mannose family sugar isomerase [Mitsuokella sp. oral taxon 131]|uniref:D-lyxose/D-mannose family sugar isomerase n=1 Tax=Mitsuokella sp. oral taxon 131 TaxID=1321780 RepID=UPI000427DA18|nr:D-lyxose/D-mannose family sugar isomerase [Mitsuokella sp. oral taxon 131]
MKRSDINQIIQYTIQATEDFKIPLPPFAYYTPEDWRKVQEDEEEIVDNMLGWDVTDFDTNDFLHTGLTAFTFRNGNYKHKDRYPKPYCEKLLFVRDGQILPFHFHWYKMEDIINRGGGDLRIVLYNSDENEQLSDTPVKVKVDGKKIVIHAGGSIVLKPGQSVTLNQKQYHQWQGIPGTGDIALFEVSMTNDDRTDNRFLHAQSRLPKVEEDELPQHLMFKDYKDYIAYGKRSGR